MSVKAGASLTAVSVPSKVSHQCGPQVSLAAGRWLQWDTKGLGPLLMEEGLVWDQCCSCKAEVPAHGWHAWQGSCCCAVVAGDGAWAANLKSGARPCFFRAVFELAGGRDCCLAL